jgi:hypothetical protein
MQTGEDGFSFFECNAAQTEDLAARQLAGDQLDGAFGDGKALGEEGDEGLVGAAFNGRRVDGDLQLRRRAFAVEAGDGRLLGSGMGANGQGDAVRRRAQQSSRCGMGRICQNLSSGLAKISSFCWSYVRR